MDSNKRNNRSSVSRLRSCWPRLISPVSWWHCFSLLYDPFWSAREPSKSSGKRSRRTSLETLKFISLHIFLLILAGLWCYFYYMIMFDAGQYLKLLSNISSNRSSIAEGRERFQHLIWRTTLKTLFISADFGLINAFGIVLASLWRQRLCKRFYQIIFRSSNGCLLYDTAQHSAYDLPTQLTNDIRQFTTHLSIALFGSLFFSGFLAVSAAVVVFSLYIVQQTNGDTIGIGICFGAFAVSVLFVSFASYQVNRSAVEQLKAKGKIRSFLQRLQTNAECVAFYGSSRYCELVSYLKLNKIAHRWNVLAAIWYAFVTFPLIFMDWIGGFVTYILPAILFLFLRKAEDQTADEASRYLGIIAFYGYVFWLLNSIVYINESCLIAVTFADRLWALKQRLIRLQEFHSNRLKQDQVSELQIESPDLIELVNLRITVPDEDGQRVLQANIHLKAQRGECVMITGTTGCGKTSLFRICAGLWPVDADLVRLPARQQTIYVPQRPYLPIGSLRFQALFLCDIRCGTDSTVTIDDSGIRELFQLVNMDYLLDRYDLDQIVEWPAYLSIGEQQRLAFVRLFALFQYFPSQAKETLVMFDESTSAIDIATETVIYRALNELQVWYITISHRSSLIKYHQKELKLYSPSADQKENEFRSNNAIDISTEEECTLMEIDDSAPDETQSTNVAANDLTSDFVEVKTPVSRLRQLRDVWNLIHLPFGPDDRTLRIQTYLGWCAYLILLGCYSYLSYRVSMQTGAIFEILPDYAASKINVPEGRSQMRQLIGPFLLQIFSVNILFSVMISVGQVLGALYTRRQSTYVARLLLDDDDEHPDTLYHTSTLKLLPNIISHDLAEMNVHLFHLLIGSMYYSGLLGAIANCIPYTILLARQEGSGIGILIVYLYQLFTSLLIICVIRPYYRTNVNFENTFALFTNAQKRVDLQAEQIALSDRSIIEIEQSHLQAKLDASIRAQTRFGYCYGLLAACSVLGNWSGTIVKYAIPALIYFYLTAAPTVSQASAIITLTVYTGYLRGTLATFNAHGQPFSQVWTIARRICQNLEQLIASRELHRHHRALELSSGRRIEVNPWDHSQLPSFALHNVNVCIPSHSSSVLIQSLSFTLDSQSSLIITGSSGSGKSSLLRILAGLQYNLTDHAFVRVPSRYSMIYLPQQLHLIEGTLREQLNYFRQAKCLAPMTDDHKIKELFSIFNLTHLLEHYTLDSSVHLWSRTLSLGEQQRLVIVAALLALFQPTEADEGGYRQSKYLVLDETTAGCDELTEKTIYDDLRKSHIQYISISHRKQLIKYHTHHLVINPQTHSYEFIRHF